VGFRQINPDAGAAAGRFFESGVPTNQSRKIIRWEPNEWADWKENFASVVNRFWDGKFWLINDCRSFAFHSGGTTYYPNVLCRLKFVANEAGAGRNHYTIGVVRLDSTESFFRSTSPLFSNKDTTIGLYSSKDTNRVLKGRTKSGQLIFQCTAVHEVGHLLGLSHVDFGKPDCPLSGDRNLNECYGVDDEDRRSVMGAGMELLPQYASRYAYSWRTAMRQYSWEEYRMTKNQVPGKVLALTSPISSMQAIWPADMQMRLPRTAAEVDKVSGAV